MKIFMAGTYSHKYVVEEHKNDYILESFYSIKEWQIPYIKECNQFLFQALPAFLLLFHALRYCLYQVQRNTLYHTCL